MKKHYFFTIATLFAFMFTVLFFSGCGVARDFTYIKQKAVGVDNVKNQEEFDKNVKVKSKKRKVDGVKIVQHVIYGPTIGYGSVNKEERLNHSDKTDVKYGLFRYRLYYDYSAPETIMIFIDEDSGFNFNSAFDQSGTELQFIPAWPKDHLFKEYTTYKGLYTVFLPFEYVESHKEAKSIVIDLVSSEKGHANNFATALYSKASDLSRTFHIPQFYIKGFLNAVEKYRPVQSDEVLK